MKLKRFNESENQEDITLYRLVCVPKGKPLVVDINNPGKYYFRSKNDINPNILDNKQDGELHVIQVETNSSNIDAESSKKESELHSCDCIVLKDDSEAEIILIEPYNKVETNLTESNNQKKNTSKEIIEYLTSQGYELNSSDKRFIRNKLKTEVY